MKCSEKAGRLALFAAVAVGIIAYAVLVPTVVAEAVFLFPALIAIGALGAFTLLLAAVLGCGCRSFRSAFCPVGLYAVIGAAGTVIAALFTALIGIGVPVAFRIGTALSLALLTLMLSSVAGLCADYIGCFDCGCGDDNDSCGDGVKR